MDTVTHALTGVGIYGAWTLATNPAFLHTPVASGVLAAAVIASEIPDIDYVFKLSKGPVAYLRQHRAASHGVPFWFIWPLLIAIGISLWVPRHFGLFFGISLISVLIHIGSDILNTYGTQAFWPFSKRRLALDTIFVTDFVWLILGIFGVVFAAMGWPAAKAVSWFGGAVLVYLVLRIVYSIYLHVSLRRQHGVDWHVTIVPRPLPWWWSYVAESKTHIIAGQITLSGTAHPEVRWPKAAFHSEVAKYVFEHTELGVTFRKFARHLLWNTTKDGDTIRVSMADAVYRYNRMFPFAASVTVKKAFDGQLELVEESLKGQILDMKALFQDAQDVDDNPRAEFTIPPANP